MAWEILSVYEFHEDMERGQKERSCFSLKTAVALLLSVSCHTGEANYELQTPGKDYSPSHFLLGVRIFKNSIENEASLITPFTDFLNYANHWKPRNCLLRHSAFLPNVSDFTVQHSAVTGVVMCTTSLLSEIRYILWYLQLYLSCRLSLILHQTGHGHSHGAQAREFVSAPLEKAALSNASLRAAFVHTIGDLFQSISVLISALIIFFKVGFITSYACLAINAKCYFPSVVTLRTK